MFWFSHQNSLFYFQGGENKTECIFISFARFSQTQARSRRRCRLSSILGSAVPSRAFPKVQSCTPKMGAVWRSGYSTPDAFLITPFHFLPYLRSQWLFFFYLKTPINWADGGNSKADQTFLSSSCFLIYFFLRLIFGSRPNSRPIGGAWQREREKDWREGSVGGRDSLCMWLRADVSWHKARLCGCWLFN